MVFALTVPGKTSIKEVFDHSSSLTFFLYYIRFEKTPHLWDLWVSSAVFGVNL